MLSRSLVINAGVALICTDGLSALGLRSVAARLAVTPMALDRYVTVCRR